MGFITPRNNQAVLVCCIVVYIGQQRTTKGRKYYKYALYCEFAGLIRRTSTVCLVIPSSRGVFNQFWSVCRTCGSLAALGIR